MTVSWVLRKKDDPVFSDLDASLQSLATYRAKKASIIGYLQYNGVNIFPLDGDLVFPVSNEHIKDSVVHAPLWTAQLDGRTFGGHTLRDLCTSRSTCTPRSAFVVSSALAEMLLKEEFKTISVIAIAPRMPRCTLVHRFPKRYNVKKFIMDGTVKIGHTDNVAGASHDTTHLLQLPAGTPDHHTPSRKRFGPNAQHYTDPVNTLKYLRFCKHLKSLDGADLSLTDAIDAACDDDTLVRTVQAQRPRHAKKRQEFTALG
jgi:hypothetical protein